MTNTSPIARESLLIRGGRVLDPSSGMDATADVVVDAAGTIVAIGPDLSSEGARVIEASGLLVVPGLIDPHVHLREPGGEHKETIATGTAAAVAGGFSTVCCMPNTTPALDSAASLEDLAERCQRTARCRVYPVAAGTIGRKGEQPAPTQALASAGAVGISDDGDAIADPALMGHVMMQTARTGLAFMQHCQDPRTTVGASMHDGEVAVRLGLVGWPRHAETSIIERDIQLVEQTGCAYHVQHLSCRESIDLIRSARAKGLPVTAEASPHHLMLTHEACEGFNTLAKMNPPLREDADVEALRQAVHEGVITVLATDHAPHAEHEKQEPFESAPFGIIGLETALSLYAEALVETGLIDWPRLIALMTVEPARLCRLDGLGSLRVGGPADITLVDPEHEWTFDESQVAGRSANSPFLGRRMKARPVATIVAGHVVHDALGQQAGHHA